MVYKCQPLKKNQKNTIFFFLFVMEKEKIDTLTLEYSIERLNEGEDFKKMTFDNLFDLKHFLDSGNGFMEEKVKKLKSMKSYFVYPLHKVSGLVPENEETSKKKKKKN